MIGIVAFVLIVIVLARRQRIDRISETNNQTGSEPIIPRSAQLYNSLKWIFLIIGIGSIITGLFSVYGYFFSDLAIYQSKIGIYGTIFNFSFGAINLICYWLYINRKIIIVWVYGASQFFCLLSILML